MELPINSSLTYSPTWYSADALDTLEWDHDCKSGIFYYSARNSIYFIKLKENSSDIKVINNKVNKNTTYDVKLYYFFKAHHEYVVGVCTIINGKFLSFNKERKMAKILSCGKDKMIRVWSFEEDNGCSLLKEFNISCTKLFTYVTCISINEFHTVVCGFEKGFLLSWNYFTDNEYNTFNTENEDIIQIVWHGSKFAIGYKRGLVSIYNMIKYDSISKLTRFRAHQMDTCNISWNPIVNSIETWGDIVTVGKDNRVNIWCIDTNVNMKTLKLSNVGKKQVSDGIKDTNSNWYSLCWSTIDHGSLIISNSSGNLGIWKNPSDTELTKIHQSSQFKTHTKCIFGIKEFRNYTGLLVSHSLDRTININRISDGGCVCSIPGLGGSIMSISGSDNNYQLAIGCGDNTIRLWKYDCLKIHQYDVSNMWNGINGKVLSLSWHPFNEGILAFGTDDGQVGIINVGKDKKIALNSQLQHKSKVFVVTWGLDIRLKDLPEAKQNLIIYSIGNYSFYGHDIRRDDYFDATSFVSEGNTGISDVCIHNSKSYMAIGYTNGLVNVFLVATMTILCTIKIHSKSINCMRWSQFENGDILAIGSNERFLSITDLEKVFKDFHQCLTSNWIILDITDTVAMFKGHGDRITCVDWCPIDNDRLVSGSYDYTAFVWSIKMNGPIISFNCHQGKLLCCHWSTYDTDIIYTGGDDSNLFSWRLSEQSLKSKFNKRRQRNDIPGITLLSNKFDNDMIEFDIKNDIIDKNLDEKIHLASIETSIVQSKITPKKLFVKKRSSLFPTTLFSFHHPLEEQQYSVLKFINNEVDYLSCFDIFSSRSKILKQIDVELENHLKDGNYENYFMILIWVGKIDRVISESISMNYTQDWLMTIIFGHMSKCIPEELIQSVVSNSINIKKDILLAATYWLSINQSIKAIDLLVSQQCVREAFVLAKLRLSPDHPIIKFDLLLLLQAIYFKNGSYELAAMCHLSVHNFKDFIETLNKRKSFSSSWVIMKTLFKFRQDEIAQQYVINFVNEILLMDDKANIQLWIDKLRMDTDLSYYSVLIDIHQAIWVEYKTIYDVVALIRHFCLKYDKDRIIHLLSQINNRLLAKQVNEIESQLALYITHELFVVTVNYIYNMDNSILVLDSLKECVEKLVKINGDDFLVKRLLSIEILEDDPIIEKLRVNLLRFTIDKV